VDSAVDVAKEAADIVLMEKDLQVLQHGILDGRKTYINTLKYIFITTSANFGNMFSLAGVSLFISYLPLLPKQVLLLNFLSTFLRSSSRRIKWTKRLQQPKKWNIKLIRQFIFVFRAQSSVFDFLTFGYCCWFFKIQESVFQTAWFVSRSSPNADFAVIRDATGLEGRWPWLLWAGALVVGLTLLLPTCLRVATGFAAAAGLLQAWWVLRLGMRCQGYVKEVFGYARI
jgi:Mg2+-importing ATPase